MKYSKANIIAEIGCNHKGELDIFCKTAIYSTYIKIIKLAAR